MAITPATVSFTYKKTTGIPPGQLLSHERIFSSIPTLNTIGLPNYLDFYDITTSTLKVKVNASNANNLLAGTHTETVTLVLHDVDLEKDFVVGDFLLTLVIEDTIVLNVSPVSSSFEFQIGSTAPVNKSFSIVSENAWTISKTQAWCTLSKTSGSNSDTFDIGVVTTGLSAGNYSDTVTINDGVSQKTIAVSFVVTDSNTGTDYLYVSPSNNNFAFTVGGAIPPVKNIEINSSASWSAVVSAPWIEASSVSGTFGPQIITVGLKAGVDLTALPEGNHTATVTITSGGFNKTVFINLNVYNFTTELPNNSTLLFACDENYVKLESSRLDTYVKMVVSTLYKNINYLYNMRLPIHNGGATKRIGIVPKKIIGRQPLIGFADFSFNQPYTPLVLNLNLHETEYYTEVMAASTAVSNLKFIKGTKPIDSWLSEIPKTIFVTKKAIVCFSVLSNNTTIEEIFISGDHTLDLDVDDNVSTQKSFYTCVLPLAQLLPNLKPGEEIKVRTFSEELKIVIRDEGPDHTTVFWENKNGVWDTLECIGKVKETPGVKRTIASFRKSEKKNVSKVIDTTNPINYTINTGLINSVEEIDTINKMLDSDNIYIHTANKTVPVIPKTTKITTRLTDRENTSFDLAFLHTEE